MGLNRRKFTREFKEAAVRRLDKAVPTVSYVTLSVRVQPVSSYPASSSVAEPLLNSEPQSGSGGPTGAKHAAPKKPK